MAEASGTSVPIPKFVSIGGALVRTSESRRTLATPYLVPLLNPKFAFALPARLCELRVRGTAGTFYHIGRSDAQYQLPANGLFVGQWMTKLGQWPIRAAAPKIRSQRT